MDKVTITLKEVLQYLDGLREHFESVYHSLVVLLGPMASFVENESDLNRLVADDPYSLQGSYMDTTVLRACWYNGITYHWHYKGTVFSVEPCDQASEYGFWLTFHDGSRTKVPFNGLIVDSIDTGDDLWDMMHARIQGLCDGHVSASKVAGLGGMKVEDEDGRPMCDGTYYGG